MTVIDRFENGFAVLETENGILNVERSQLPSEACEGDIVEQSGSSYVINKEATAERRKKMNERLKRLIQGSTAQGTV